MKIPLFTLFASLLAAAPGITQANDSKKAIKAGLDWLATQQAEDGSFSDADFPGLTAFAMLSFANSDHPEKDRVLADATKFLRSCVQENGAIHVKKKIGRGDGLPNYNTAVCLRALHATRNPELTPILLKARSYLASTQVKSEDANKTGGWGYGPPGKKPHVDMLNTAYVLEAMHETKDLEEERDRNDKKAEIDKDAAAGFIENLQHGDEAGNNAGGFKYSARQGKGILSKLRGGSAFSAYGSLSYAGTLALIHADVKHDDPRVQSALHWSRKNWTLEENPGMGTSGLYFFYHVMTKCLDAADVDKIPVTVDDKEVNLDWRKEVTTKLIGLQKTDGDNAGSWVNDNGRWWENDPVLVTAYAVMTLQHTQD